MDGEPGFFMDKVVAIVGLGLMGGSMALGLKDQCSRVLGVDADPLVLDKARRDGCIQESYSSIAELPEKLDMIIMSMPIRAILKIIPTLGKMYPGSAIVLDLGSTKAQITQAMENLPDRFDPLGGHPMCGKETAGYDQADAAIYHDAAFAFTPLRRTTNKARRFARELALLLGAWPYWLDADVHDRHVAATSHLPYLLANLLSTTMPLEAAPLAGPGFASATRLAATPVEMMEDILHTNRNHILNAIHVFQVQLEKLQTCLDMEDEYAWKEQIWAGSQKHKTIMTKRRLMDQQ